MEQWLGFNGKKWQQVIDVEDFIVNNYTEYTGNEDFLKGTTKKTNKLIGRFQKLIEKEDINKILDIEKDIYSGIDKFECGYLDRRNELIVGLQTDEPLKLIINPFISLDSSVETAKNYGYRISSDVLDKFEDVAKSHEEAVVNTYTDEIKKYKEVHLLEGLPENYGRGHIVSDYRRVALYGVDYLIAKKKNDLNRLRKDINYSMVRTREEVVNQITALNELKNMAKRYDIDISLPASNTREAIQWLYFAFLASAKETNGATMPLSNITSFLDIYIERDLELGNIKEEEVQELIDQFIIKLRLIRHLRPLNFNNYFAGRSPIITEVIGGIRNDKSMITKTAYRFLNTFENLGVYANPSFTILWNEKLPDNFKNYCSKIMNKYNVLQFLNDKLIQSSLGTDYTVNGLIGTNKIGKQIDYYGGVCNLPKALLYAINGGKDEITGEVIIPGIEPITTNTIGYSTVVKNFVQVIRKLITVQCDALNIIHYMHDKYAYESSMMALNDTIVERYMTFSIAGFSTVVDSLCALRYSKVKVNRDDRGIIIDYVHSGGFPRFGNNDDQADKMASDIVKILNRELGEHHLYRNAKAKLGLDSNIINIFYGNNTGATPDGRFKNVSYPFGANAVSNVDHTGALNAMKSIIKLPNSFLSNGVVNTININMMALGEKKNERTEKLVSLLDSYFNQRVYQIELNIIDKKLLLAAQKKEQKYDNLIIRNGGIPVRYCELSEVEQDNLLDKTFHGSL